jgi:hypothetical protein
MKNLVIVALAEGCVALVCAKTERVRHNAVSTRINAVTREELIEWRPPRLSG